jgi:hypothetical protein
MRNHLWTGTPNALGFASAKVAIMLILKREGKSVRSRETLLLGKGSAGGIDADGVYGEVLISKAIMLNGRITDKELSAGGRDLVFDLPIPLFADTYTL